MFALKFIWWEVSFLFPIVLHQEWLCSEQQSWGLKRVCPVLSETTFLSPLFCPFLWIELLRSLKIPRLELFFGLSNDPLWDKNTLGRIAPGTDSCPCIWEAVKEKREPSIGRKKVFSMKGLELTECEKHWTGTHKIWSLGVLWLKILGQLLRLLWMNMKPY